MEKHTMPHQEAQQHPRVSVKEKEQYNFPDMYALPKAQKI